MSKHTLLIATVVAGALAVQAGVSRADDAFDSTGWTLLGEQTVDGAHDTDTIKVGRTEGRFSKLTFVVLDDDLILENATVTFANKETFAPEVKQHFQEGTRTRAIDLPGEARGIASIELTYGDLDDGKGKGHKRRHVRDKATPKVQVWGLEAAAASAPAWSSAGWSSIAKKAITTRKGTVTLKARGKTKYRRLTIAVSDGGMRATSITIAFATGKKATMSVDQRFDASTRTQTFDLPGGRPMAIKSIAVKYSERTGSKRATVEVWGEP